MKGQSNSELQKNKKRIDDIISKSNGDVEMEIKLAKRQAALITNEYKAINRAMVAKDLGKEEIFHEFFTRAYELGNVGQMEYRLYVIAKIMED